MADDTPYFCIMHGAVTKILVIRFSSIGDIVLTTPVVRALSQHFNGQAEIHFLTKHAHAPLLEANPHIHRVHAMHKTVQEVLPELEACAFDYIFDLHSNIRSRVVKRKLGALSFTVDKQNGRKWLLVKFGIRRKPIEHIVQRYLNTLRAFQCHLDDRGLEYYIPKSTEVSETMNQATEKPFLVFVLGATHAGKKLKPHQWTELAKRIHHPIVLIGGEQEQEISQAIIQGNPKSIYNFCGEISLHQSAWLISKSALVISGDTGMMHVAAAFQKNIISLWGCTSPELGMSPFKPGEHSVIIEPHNRKKRPCSKLGDRCKYGTEHSCIEQLNLEEVTRATEKLWAQQKAPLAL